MFKAYKIPKTRVLPGASPPGPSPGLCPGPTGGLKAAPDPLPQIMLRPSNVSHCDPTFALFEGCGPCPPPPTKLVNVYGGIS